MFREEYVKALELLAKAFECVAAKGRERPVIVGGAAVEFYTGGKILFRSRLCFGDAGAGRSAF